MTLPKAEWARRLPSGPLSPYVHSYIGYRLVGFPPGLHRGLPSHNMTFIVSIGPPIDVAVQTNPAQSPSRYRTVVSGLHTTPATISHDGTQEGVAVMLSPLGSRTVLGLPARALWNTSVELGDVVGRWGDELWERLHHLDSWTGRFAAIDAMLARMMGRSGGPGGEVERAWMSLTNPIAPRSVSEVAEDVGWTRQHLSRRFRREFGVTPKQMLRVCRFEGAVRMIHSTPRLVSLAEIAIASGYYDQAHMARDFAEFAGCSPGAVNEGEQVPNFQDNPAESE